MKTKTNNRGIVKEILSTISVEYRVCSPMRGETLLFLSTIRLKQRRLPNTYILFNDFFPIIRFDFSFHKNCEDFKNGIECDN